ncbi:MAG: hemolysin family protein [Verrucomicrobiota bacterium]
MHFDLSILLKFLAVIFLVLLNGFFVAAEFALVKIRDTQLDALVNRGNRRAKLVRHIIAHLNAYLSATQLGITMASLGLGWVGEPVFSAVLKPLLSLLHIHEQAQHYISFVVGFSAITFLHIVAGELAPKWFAIQKPLPVSLWAALPLKWFYLASYPFNRTLNVTAQWLLRRFGVEPVSESEIVHSEEELRLMVLTSQKQTGASQIGRLIVLNALDLSRRVTRDVMRPRQEMISFDTDASIAECIDLAEKTRYSRFPLCEKGNPDKTLGVVHIKDLYAMRLKTKTAAELLPVARKLIYVPETSRLEKLLQLFLDRKSHLAIVVDEYGGTVGMVTLENILEELVGQIQDEFDQEQPLLKKQDESTWEISGALPLHDLADLVGEPLQEDGVTTTSGWVTHKLGGFPREGDTVAVGNFDLRVEETDGLRVAQLKLSRRDDPLALSESPEKN